MYTNIPRFNRTQRTVHWLHSLSFLVLLGTGLSLYLPSLASIVGNRLLFRQIHIEAAIIFIFGPIIVARLGNWRSLKEDIRQTDLWEKTDFQWLRRIGRKSNPVLGIGRFNAGQKLNSIFTLVAGLLFLATGVIMWQNPRFPQWLGENAIFLHDVLTWLVLVAWLGHLYFSAFHPATRESLRGMTLGWVKGDWANKHHNTWYAEMISRKSTTKKQNGE